MNLKYKYCGARAKQNNHKSCKSPAMKNGRCRLHGGKSTGPKTPEGKLKSARANYKHGYYTNEAIFRRKVLRSNIKEWHEELDTINNF